MTRKRGTGKKLGHSHAEPLRYVRMAFHFGTFFVTLFAFWYDMLVCTPTVITGNYLPENLVRMFNGTIAYKFVYFTIWNMVFQLMYFFICCVSDLVTSSGAHSPFTRKITAFRDWFLAAVAFPIGTLVVTVFWAIWAVNRELIFPKALDNFFPAWLNHVMHTTVLPVLLLDMFLVRHRYPSKVSGILGLVAVSATYLCWLLWLGFVADIWVYPFLKVLNGAVFAAFFVGSSVAILGMYFLGEKISKVFWRGYADYDSETRKLD